MRYTSEPIIRLSFFYSMEFAAVQVWLNLTYWTFTILCPKSSKSVYNGRGGGHILSPHPVWFFLKLSPWSRKTNMKSFPAHQLLHEPSSIFTYHRSMNSVLESPEGSVYDSQLCTSGISFKPVAEAWLVLSKTWHWLQFRHFYFHVARLRRSMFLYYLVI